MAIRRGRLLVQRLQRTVYKIARTAALPPLRSHLLRVVSSQERPLRTTTAVGQSLRSLPYALSQVRASPHYYLYSTLSSFDALTSVFAPFCRDAKAIITAIIAPPILQNDYVSFIVVYECFLHIHTLFIDSYFKVATVKENESTMNLHSLD